MRIVADDPDSSLTMIVSSPRGGGRGRSVRGHGVEHVAERVEPPLDVRAIAHHPGVELGERLARPADSDETARRRSSTRPARFKTPSCWLTADWVTSSEATSAETLRSPSASVSSSARRVGDAIA